MESDELGAFYARACPPLIGLLTAMCGSRSDAEEVAHDAFVKLVAEWEKVSGYEQPEAWLRTVAIRLLINRRRKFRNWLITRASIASQAEQTSPGPSVNSVAVATALGALSVEHRAVLILHHVLDLPLDEVAHILALPTGTVKSRLARGRAAMAPLLSDEEMSIHE